VILPDLAVILASFGTADAAAAAASHALSISPLLTDSEQTLYGETIAAQERDHGRVSMAWAQKHGWTPSRGVTPHAALAQREARAFLRLPEPMATAYILATVRLIELQAVHGFRALSRTFDLSEETRPMAGDYRQIATDERMHVAVNLAITRRLGETDRDFRRIERQAFQAARKVYNPLALGNVWRP
jgi:hypothetical protein